MSEDKLLHAQVFGEGKPFVILHGFLGMGDNWKTLGLKYAESGYQVHLLDLRNHGRSFHSSEFNYETMVKDVDNYCNKNELSDIILLGHSMGGKVAMLYATEHPEIVSKLIIADIGPKTYPPHHQDIIDGLQKLKLSEYESRADAEEDLAKYIDDAGVRLFLLKNLYRKNKTEFGLRMNLDVLAESMEEIGVALPKGYFYDGNTLFLRGEKSGYIKDNDKELIKNHFPKAEIETILEAGHWLHAENPDMFFKKSISFLRR